MKYFLLDYWGSIVPLFVGIISAILAALHYDSIHDIDIYRRSLLIPAEVVLVSANLFWGLALIAVLFKNLYFQAWKEAAMNIVGIAIAFIALLVTVQLDSPTLLYAT